MRRAEMLLVAVAVVLAACAPRVAPSATSAPSPHPTVPPSASASASADVSPPASATAPTPSPSAAGVGRLPGEPDPHLTPGATNPAVTQATIGSTICVSGWTATVRPPSSYTTPLKREQIAAYRYTDTDLADYEEDHLIPLELGGAPSDPRNLWPEPYAVTLADGTPDGARVKDQLENRLRSLVCDGALPLAAAQHAIAADWVRAWLTYVGPGAGVPSPALASSTAPAPVSDPSSAVGGPTVGSRTSAGSWPVTVTCSAGGSSASASATLVVG